MGRKALPQRVPVLYASSRQLLTSNIRSEDDLGGGRAVNVKTIVGAEPSYTSGLIARGGVVNVKTIVGAEPSYTSGLIARGGFVRVVQRSRRIQSEAARE